MQKILLATLVLAALTGCDETAMVPSDAEVDAAEPPPGGEPLGGACSETADCEDDLVCLAEAGYPGGFCTRSCVEPTEPDQSYSQCGGRGVGICIAVGGEPFRCHAYCSAAEPCRDGWTCVGPGDLASCQP